MQRFITLTSGLIAASAVAMSCGDDLTAPEVTQPAASVPLGLSEEERASVQGAVLFASEHSVRALEHRHGAPHVAGAFAELRRRVEADDRAGTQRAVTTAREALTRYRAVARDPAAAADLQVMDLTLERVASLVLEAAARSESARAPVTPTPAKSSTYSPERRP